MKKKGFTLIELLAVIIILAVIALITTVVVLGIIKDTRRSSFSASKKNIEKAAQVYYSRNSENIGFDNGVAYVELGTLMNEGYLDKDIENLLTKEKMDPSSKVLIYKKNGKLSFALQMYDEAYLNWYKEEMIKAVRDMKLNKSELPKEIGLEELMDSMKVSELRLPTKLEDRCVGYVEAKEENNEVKYESYVDCLTSSSSFASHYVSYGGKYLDWFLDVKETSDGGYIAVGQSNSEVITKYGTGNNGKYDAIIVKFAQNGEVEWSRNFGGSNDDVFNAVVEGPNGYVAVGKTTSNDIDLAELYKGGHSDALIVAYDKQGNVTYERSYGAATGTNGREEFNDIIVDGNNYVIVGSINAQNKDGDLEGSGLSGDRSSAIILKLDFNFNQQWRSFFTGTFSENFKRIIKTEGNNYIVVGNSSSFDYDMTGLSYDNTYSDTDAIIIEYNKDGNLVSKNSLKGSKNDIFFDVVEVDDGYVIVGHTASADGDFTGLNKADNAYLDAIIVKYDKSFNVVWKKVFGGSEIDEFTSISKVNNSEVLVVGYSQSSDMDMQGISKTTDGYRNGLIIKYNVNNGNIIQKKTFGGSNSEVFNSIIKTKNNYYIVAGSSYSNNIDLKNFNKGHQDAVLVKYDSNLNLKKDLQEQVVLIDKIKDIKVNYGTKLNLKYNNIYTTNDPTKDLGNWCTSIHAYTEDENTSNYYYWCLEPFNPDDKKTLTDKEVNSGLRFYEGEHEYSISRPISNSENWLALNVYASGSTGNAAFSNLKLKFNDGYVGHITDAVNKGYIEPLVIVTSVVNSTRPASLLPSVIDIINENGDTGIGSYPYLRLLFKPKKSEFKSLILISSVDSKNQDGIAITEFRNFDISITPTN